EDRFRRQRRDWPRVAAWDRPGGLQFAGTVRTYLCRTRQYGAETRDDPSSAVRSLERFCGVLIEHFAGSFPVWLAPEQVRVLPISEKHLEYGRSIRKLLSDQQIRVTMDETSDKIGAKIRLA